METLPRTDQALDPGTPVEVRNRFNEEWAPGFSVERAVHEGYTVRRVRDGAVLPLVVAHDDIRAV